MCFSCIFSLFFVCLSVLRVLSFVVLFLFLLVSGIGGLRLWHSLDFLFYLLFFGVEKQYVQFRFL